jgi:hypothetical protein
MNRHIADPGGLLDVGDDVVGGSSLVESSRRDLLVVGLGLGEDLSLSRH